MKVLPLLVLIINFNVVLAQVHSKNQININGEVIGKAITNDSIYFNSGDIDSKYFEKPLLPTKLIGNKFIIKNELPYPQMFRIVFLSDKNIRVWRFGKYFIEPSTNFIKVNYSSEECNMVDGQTENEYLNKFIPFFLKNKLYDCKSNDMFQLGNDKIPGYDSTLLNYVVKYPHSYVALWSLIERFSLFGQSELRQQTLECFSKKIKNEKLWKILNEDFKNEKIKENERFPDLDLKTYDLTEQKLVLPKSKYTLIDYWFCRCRPCLDTIPVLKQLYSAYKDKGFEIISISVDETKNVPLWQKRVKEHGLTWVQYLDENDFVNNKLGIKSFPSFILLDSKGKVIWRDFDLHDLDKFLTEHL